MPQPVAEIVQPLAVVGLEDAVLGIEIADVGQVLVQAQLVVLARLEDRGLERPEVAGEVELALVVELLVGKDQHGILGEGGADGGEIVGGKRLAERDVAHFGGEIGGDRLDGDGHGFLLGSSRSCVWPRLDHRKALACKCLAALCGGDFHDAVLVLRWPLLLGFSTAKAPPTENEFSYSGA